MPDVHTLMMKRAIVLAKKAFLLGEVPVGAVVYTEDGAVLGEAHNAVEKRGDPTAHAEMLALVQARKVQGDAYLTDAFLAVTLEPCALCAQAIAYHRLKGIYFGAYDVKSGGTVNGARIFDHSHHKPSVVDGFMQEETKNLLPNFFQKKR